MIKLRKDNCLTLIGLNAAQFSELNTKIKNEKINIKINAQLDFLGETNRAYLKYLAVCGAQWTSDTVCKVNKALKECNIPYMVYAQSDLGV